MKKKENRLIKYYYNIHKFRLMNYKKILCLYIETIETIETI